MRRAAASTIATRAPTETACRLILTSKDAAQLFADDPGLVG